MNRYGVIAQQHWMKYLPNRYARLQSPTEFFTNLGEEIEQRVQELMEASKPELTKDYLANLQALNWTQQQAESEALQELALLPAESDSEA